MFHGRVSRPQIGSHRLKAQAVDYLTGLLDSIGNFMLEYRYVIVPVGGVILAFFWLKKPVSAKDYQQEREERIRKAKEKLRDRL